MVFEYSEVTIIFFSYRNYFLLKWKTNSLLSNHLCVPSAWTIWVYPNTIFYYLPHIRNLCNCWYQKKVTVLIPCQMKWNVILKHIFPESSLNYLEMSKQMCLESHQWACLGCEYWQWTWLLYNLLNFVYRPVPMKCASRKPMQGPPKFSKKTKLWILGSESYHYIMESLVFL